MRDTYEGCQLQIWAKQRRAKLICEDEIGNDQREWRCVLLKKYTNHRSICFLISYLNCFSTKSNNSVQVCATRPYHDSDEETDGETNSRTKVRWEQAERRPRPRRRAGRPPRRNMSRAEMGVMLRLPGASRNETSQSWRAVTSRNNLRRFCAKWSRRMRNPFSPFQSYVRKRRIYLVKLSTH